MDSMKTRSGLDGGFSVVSILSTVALAVVGVACLAIPAGLTTAAAALEVHPQEPFSRVTDSDVVRGGGGFQGSGWADYDQDGDLDLFVCSHTVGGILYRNDGGGVLTKTTGVLAIPTGAASQGCTWGDYDNDGYPDLFVANRDGRNNFLFHNRGDGTFERITTGAVVVDGGDSIACAWVDYDRDGFLDLFVADLSWANRLYHNERNGTFTRVTTGEIVNDTANTVGCAWGDYDNDGYPDLFVANGGGHNNALYHNLHSGTFEKITAGSIVNDGGYSDGCAWGDYDNDGWLDLIVANRLGINFLYRNNGDGKFTRITEGEIAKDDGYANGLGWADYDDDGWLDLVVVNQGSNSLYRNKGDGTFEKIGDSAVSATSNTGYGGAWGDYDNDGFVDLFISDFGGANSQLFHNVGSGNAWVTIRCEGAKSNRSGIGVRVKVKTVVNGSERWQIREISSGDGWRDNGPYANFGLGTATVIDTVEVRWPSGAVRVLRNVGVSQMLVIKEIVPTLVIEPSGGSFSNTVRVVAVSEVVGGAIRYTVNGVDPVASSPRFPSELVLSETTILKAKVFLGDAPATETVTAVFTRVVPPPRIAVQPSPLTVQEGADARFSVTAEGVEPLYYQWLWQGAVMVGATNAELALKSVRGDQAGTYTVRASNAGGEVVSDAAVLVVRSREVLAGVTDSDVVRGGGGFQGSGWADYDQDGDLDLFVCSLTVGGILYRNDGGGVLTKTTGVLPIPAGASQGCTWGDYDNDGYPDLFVANRDGRNNFLFRNHGDGTFERVTTGAVVADGGDSIACAWVDYDRDGFLDLFVADLSWANRLYHNERNGTFTRVTTGEIVNDTANTVGCAWGDYDNDGYPDLFVANGGNNDNALYRNLGNGTFEKVTVGSIVHDGGYGDGCAWGDYNNDGWLDMFVANRLGNNFLYRNNGDGSFTRIGEGQIVSDGGYSNGAAWADYNNDGFLDLFVANQGTNFLYRNKGDGTFEKIGDSAVSATSNTGYGGAWGDYDNDGFVDLFISDFGGANSQLYHNTGNSNAWVTIRCEGAKSNRSGIGVRVKVKTVVNGSERWQIREISSGDGWRDNGPYANFGLGTATVIDTVEVRWPSGAVRVLRNVGVSQMLVIKEIVPTLVIEPSGGSFSNTVRVVAVSEVVGGAIRYTVNGVDPVASSPRFPSELVLSETTILKAKVFLGDAPVTETVTAVFTRVVPPPRIAVQPSPLTMQEGGDARFSVTAEGVEPLYYQWLWQGAAMVGATNAELALKSVRGDQAGTYTVRVSNAGGEVVSDAAVLVVRSREVLAGVTDSDVVRGGGGFQGSGWADYDQDGDLDLFVCSLTEGGILYRNDGGGVLTKTTGVLPIPAGASQACAWGDYDNDGYPDLFVANRQGGNDYLFHNRGNGTFERILTGTILNDAAYSIACEWVDYDRDGLLDLFIVDMYGKCRLYHNEGGGAFTKILQGDMVNDVPDTQGCAWGDYDNDGYPDLFLTHGGNKDNALYHNLGNGTFEKITTGSIVHDGGYSLGCAWGDYNNDGWLDLFVANRLGNNFLYRNNRDGTFTRITEGQIVNDGGDSNGAAWADYDNDGFLDLFVANQGTNFLYRNRGDGTFEKITGSPTTAISNQGYGVAWGDYDNDGFVDLFISDFSGANSQLYHNTGNSNAWVTVRCEGSESSRSGVGARVKVKTVVDGSERWQIREITTGNGWRDNGPYADFGLGSAVVIDTVQIEWPSGAIQVLRNVAVNQRLVIKEPLPDLVIRPDGGSFTNTVTVVVVSGISDGVTRYTVNGEDPVVSSPQFPTELVLTATTILKARVFLGETPATDTVTVVFTRAVPPPRITAQPSPLTVQEGVDARFSVTAEGVGPLTYQWCFEGAAMVGATNAELNLKSIRLEQAGSYSVRVGNPGGEVVSAGVALMVHPQEWFVRVTDSDVVKGVGFQGSGWADYDGDGDLDLFVCSLTAGGVLYRNDGGGVLTKTTGVLPIPAGASQGCAWGDYDNDGYPDLFVANRDGRNNYLFHNRGNGTFERITTGAIVNDGGDSVACAWADYDRDGFLDLFVADLSAKNSLYHNEGNGTFRKITTGRIVNDMANTVGCAWGDYDNDGYPDLFVANGGGNDNALYRNLGNGTFEKIITGSIVHDGGYSVGCAWGDYNNDGWMDLFVANRLGKDFLYRNNGDGSFTRVTEGELVNDGVDSNGAAWGDFDNDGYLDLFVANQGTNFLYRNRGDGTFERITGITNQGYAAAWGDYDKDGFVDLFVSDWRGGGNSQLYHNTGNGNAWVTICCEGTKSNRSGIGARVKLKTVVEGSERWQIRDVSSGDGWRDNGPYANFGLGAATAIDAVLIEWPSGTLQVLRNVAINQTLTVKEASAELMIQPEDGVFNRVIEITLFTSVAEGMIYYTLDGTEPTTQSTLYRRPFRLDKSASLKARVYVGDQPVSDTKIASYRIVLSAPVIIAQPESRTVIVGRMVSFQVVAEGTPPLAYEWYHDQQRIPDATNAVFRIEEVRPDDAGQYTVKVSNPLGYFKSDPAILTVDTTSVAPTIVQGLEDQAATVGGSALFGVVVSGTEPFTYRWFRNDALVEGAVGPTLLLTNLQLSQSGSYVVIVTNLMGGVSSKATLSVTGGVVPPVIAEAPVHQRVNPGAAVALMVTLADGTPPLTYQWRFNGRIIAGATEPVLNFPSAGLSDSGTYTVTVTNSAGSVSTDGTVLDVSDYDSGGLVIFHNHIPDYGIDAPVFDSDGVTRLAGPAYLAQLYGGTNTSSLAPAGGAVPFGTGLGAGYIQSGMSGKRVIPGVAPGGSAVVQVRVWEAVKGTTFEEALAAGGMVGKSAVLTLTTGNYQTGSPIPPLTGLSSFSIGRPQPPPAVVIWSPSAGAVSDGRVTLAGFITNYAPIITARWELNGQPMTALALTNNRFATPNIALHPGENRLRVIAMDSEGDEGAAEVVVTWEPLRLLSIAGDQELQEGKRLTFGVALTSKGEVGGLTFALPYDPTYLADPDFVWAETVAAGMKNVNLSSGQVKASVAFFGGGVPAGTQTLGTVTFRARSVPARQPVSIKPEVLNVANQAGDKLTSGTDTAPGSAIILPRHIKGDNNANDVLDIGDGVLIQRMLMGLDEVRPWDVPANDLNLSADLDVGDMIKVLRAVVGIDPQPSLPAGAASGQSQRVALQGEGSPAASAVLMTDKPTVQPGEVVTLRVAFADVTHPVRGASFTVKYPSEAVRLLEAQPPQKGSIVSSDAPAMWHVKGGYAAQAGEVAGAILDATSWSSANGVVAELKFQVLPAAALSPRWSIGLEDVMVTETGYDQEFLAARAIGIEIVPPRVSGVVFKEGRLEFSLHGAIGSSCRVETSTDLEHWDTVETVVNSTGDIRYLAPLLPGSNVRFFRFRTE